MLFPHLFLVIFFQFHEAPKMLGFILIFKLCINLCFVSRVYSPVQMITKLTYFTYKR